MRVFLILVLAGITSVEVYQAVYTAQKWHSYENKIITNKDNPCPDPQVIIQRVEYNPINDLNIDSFLQVYGITAENVNGKSRKRKDLRKVDIIIEPKKIVPNQKEVKIKVNKVK